MKNKFLSYFFYLFLSVIFFFTGCKSTKPAFPNSSGTTTVSTQSGTKNQTNAPATQPEKMVAQPTPKLVYDSTKVSFKVKQKTETETRVTDDDEDGPTIESSTKIDRVEKYRKREKEKGNWLSGGFLGAGMALLAVALVLALIGSGPAGLLAIIGGVVFLAGFIFTMLALLGR